MSVSIQTKEELFAVMEQIAAEREAARPIVEQLLASGQPVEDIEIPQPWRTAGFVIEVTVAGETIDDSRPFERLSLQQLALAIASNIPVDAYPAPTPEYLLGATWNEIGWQHRCQSAYEEAVRAYLTAENHFARESALGHEELRAQLRRAETYTYTRSDEAAFRLIRETAEGFGEFGDERRVAFAEMIRAGVHFMRGEMNLACTEWERLLNVHAVLDRRTVANLLNNLGHSYVQLGRLDDAASAFERSRQIHVELGTSTDRPDWGLAYVLFHSGNFEKAMAALERLRNTFLARGTPHDAGLVGLDIVEVLIATNQIDAARTMTQQVLAEFQEANLQTEAITALGYLRDLMPRAKEARRAVRYVRSYIQQLRLDPSLAFLPMDEDL